MTSGTTSPARRAHRARRLPLLTFLMLPAIGFGAPEVDSLLKRLARPAPARTPFVEVRFSNLLAEPLLVRGELEYLEDRSLVRQVTSPFQERTEIRGETVHIQRDGKSSRKFSLRRAPELRSMLGGFTAVLGGSRDALEQDFDLVASGDDAQWQITLTPKSAATSRYVRTIVIEGSQDDARCISVTEPDDDSSIMLIGAPAESALPDPLTPEALAQTCRAKG